MSVELTAARAATLAVLVIVLAWLSGALMAGGHASSSDAMRASCERELGRVLERAEELREAAELVADDLRRAERVCSIWRGTAAWYQADALRCRREASTPRLARQ